MAILGYSYRVQECDTMVRLETLTLPGLTVCGTVAPRVSIKSETGRGGAPAVVIAMGVTPEGALFLI